ncbi:MAG: carbohydrate kinase, partial [Blastocatellia bacterium]
MMAVALAIDVGTSSVRASLWTERGVRVGEIVARATSLRVSADGAAEFDAEDLLHAVESALD